MSISLRIGLAVVALVGSSIGGLGIHKSQTSSKVNGKSSKGRARGGSSRQAGKSRTKQQSKQS